MELVAAVAFGISCVLSLAAGILGLVKKRRTARYNWQSILLGSLFGLAVVSVLDHSPITSTVLLILATAIIGILMITLAGEGTRTGDGTSI